VPLPGASALHGPIRVSFIAICGLAQLFGAFGSFLRLDGISDLATQYVTTSAVNQVLVREAYLHLWRVIHSTNHIGVLLQGMGFILIAGSVFSLWSFPRRLAIWMLLPGMLAIAQFALFIIGAQYLFLLNVIGLIAGNIALNLAITLVFWRPRSTLITAVAGENPRV